MIQTVLENKVQVKVWTKDIEEEAIRQLENLASLPFIYKHVAVMPDVHWGMGATIGAVIPSKTAVMPAAVGVDIGCGMCAVKTSFTVVDVEGKLSRIRARIERDIPVGFEGNKNIEGRANSWEGWKWWNELTSKVGDLKRRPFRSSAPSAAEIISLRFVSTPKTMSGSCFIPDQDTSGKA